MAGMLPVPCGDPARKEWTAQSFYRRAPAGILDGFMAGNFRGPAGYGNLQSKSFACLDSCNFPQKAAFYTRAFNILLLSFSGRWHGFGNTDCVNKFDNLKSIVMKKIFTLFVSSLFSLSLLAFDGSRLSISSLSTSKELKIEVDGRKFSMKNNSITLGYTTDGYHQVKIFRDSKRNGWGFGRREEVVYKGSIFLKRGYHTDITVNRFGKVLIDERRIDLDDDWYQEEDEYYDTNNGYDNDRENDNRGWNGGYGNVMKAGEFESVKESLRKEWFETNRLQSTKFIIDKNNFTTRQVKELMQLFTFENNKLEVAKYAYSKTVDKRNYYHVNEELTFSSSKEELARFIRQ